MSHPTTQARELSVAEYEDGWSVEDYVTLEPVAGPFGTKEEAERKMRSLKTASRSRRLMSAANDWMSGKQT